MNISKFISGTCGPELDFSYPFSKAPPEPVLTYSSWTPPYTFPCFAQIPFPTSLPIPSQKELDLCRFKTASYKAYELLRSLGNSHTEAVSSIFKTLAPEHDIFFSSEDNDESKYASIMKEEIDKLVRQGIGKNDEGEIIGIFVGRLESAIKTQRNCEYWKARKRKIGELPMYSELYYSKRYKINK